MGSTKKWTQLWITAISWKTLQRSSPSMLCKRKMRKKDLRNTEDRPRILQRFLELKQIELKETTKEKTKLQNSRLQPSYSMSPSLPLPSIKFFLRLLLRLFQDIVLHHNTTTTPAASNKGEVMGHKKWCQKQKRFISKNCSYNLNPQ